LPCCQTSRRRAMNSPMNAELCLRRKWTLKAHGRQLVLVKKPRERTEHVWMKAFLWALYLPEYPELTVEFSIGARYKPDVVALGEVGRPVFWGEAGDVGLRKIQALTRRYRHTHIALAKWGVRLDPFVAIVEKAAAGCGRTAPVDLIRFPRDSAGRFVDSHGTVRLTASDVERKTVF